MESMEIIKSIAENVRKARGELSRQKLADVVGCTYQTIYEIEEGRRKPSIEVLIAISEALNVSAASLLETGKSPVVVSLPVSKTLFKMAAIPDDVYELAQGVELDSEVWDTVRSALKVGAELNAKKKTSSRL